MTPMNENDEHVSGKTWSKPTFQDFGVSKVTEHRFTADIDNYEGDNPVNYGS